MKLLFFYNINKDVQNFLKSVNSINNKEHTEVQKLYVEKYGDDFAEAKLRLFIEEYLNENHINTERAVKDVKRNWKKIEAIFYEHAKMIFPKLSRKPIHAYLTINNRCTYSIKERYFFVKLQSPASNKIIMHELFHFYTWDMFGSYVTEKKISTKIYNDIKESFTELLNIEFVDLMGGEIDRGYPQHQKLRSQITEQWRQNKNIQKIFLYCINDLQERLTH